MLSLFLPTLTSGTSLDPHEFFEPMRHRRRTTPTTCPACRSQGGPARFSETSERLRDLAA